MIVRRATKDDALGIAGVSVTTWKHGYRHILPAEYLEALDVGRRALGVLKALESGAVYWVAEVVGKVVGFATAGPNQEPDIVADAELKAIYVLPDLQGRGIGRAVLVEAVRHVRDQGAKSMCVFAFRDNHSARHFYTGLGARPHDQSTYSIAGTDYPDQSYLWDSLDDLWERLTLGSPKG